MKTADIKKIRQALKHALDLVAGERIKYDAFPAEDEIDKILEGEYRVCEKNLEQTLAFLPCPTCDGSGKDPDQGSLEPCPDCT